jgi:hypothetical protein
MSPIDVEIRILGPVMGGLVAAATGAGAGAAAGV